MSATASPPSPLPPWHRKHLASDETLTGAGTISLDCEVTYLDNTTDAGPLAVVLPDALYQHLTKRIFIPASNRVDTAAFRVTGTFVGFASLLFSGIGYTAVLEWDGAGWHWLGGNAEQEAA